MNLKMANREEFIRDFIEIYKEIPALWKIKSLAYSDRRLKENGYKKLLEFYRTVDPDASVDTVKKKINNLRSTFRKELKKVEKSKRSGASTEDIYIPKLWYYELMLFTADQELPRTGRSNDDSDGSTQEDNGNDDALSPQSMSVPSEPASEQSSSSRPPSRFSETPQTKRKAQTKSSNSENTREHLLARVERELNTDEFDVTGKYIGNKLRNLPKEKENLAEKFIMDVLFAAQMGILTENSRLVHNQQANNANTQIHTITNDRTTYQSLNTLNSGYNIALSAQENNQYQIEDLNTHENTDDYDGELSSFLTFNKRQNL